MRRENDAYFTEAAVTEVLLNRIDFLSLNGGVAMPSSIFECCAGDGAISDIFVSKGFEVFTNDIDEQYSKCNTYFDATNPEKWKELERGGAGYYDWVVTNPPFNQAPLILPLAYEYARFGVAFLLRLSYLEPCKNRSEWLKKHPPKRLIVFGQPRPSFTENGKTDSCTVAWMVWEKPLSWLTEIEFVDNWETKSKSSLSPEC